MVIYLSVWVEQIHILMVMVIAVVLGVGGPLAGAVLRCALTPSCPCRCEEGVTAADVPPLEEFLGLVAGLTLCGRGELKVAVCVDNPQPPGFKFDPALTKGNRA